MANANIRCNFCGNNFSSLLTPPFRNSGKIFVCPHCNAPNNPGFFDFVDNCGRLRSEDNRTNDVVIAQNGRRDYEIRMSSKNEYGKAFDAVLGELISAAKFGIDPSVLICDVLNYLPRFCEGLIVETAEEKLKSTGVEIEDDLSRLGSLISSAVYHLIRGEQNGKTPVLKNKADGVNLVLSYFDFEPQDDCLDKFEYDEFKYIVRKFVESGNYFSLEELVKPDESIGPSSPQESTGCGGDFFDFNNKINNIKADCDFDGENGDLPEIMPGQGSSYNDEEEYERDDVWQEQHQIYLETLEDADSYAQSEESGWYYDE